METNKKIKAFTDYLDSVNDDFLKEPEAINNCVCKFIELPEFATVKEKITYASFIAKACNEYDKLKEDNAMLLEAIKIADKWMYIKGAYNDNGNEYDIIRFKEIFAQIK